jgi:hypothetical protein
LIHGSHAYQPLKAPVVFPKVPFKDYIWRMRNQSTARKIKAWEKAKHIELEFLHRSITFVDSL